MSDSPIKTGFDSVGKGPGFARLEPNNPYARISDLAAKVGIKPLEKGQGGIVAKGADGNRYDIFEVIIAVLDKMEKSA